MIKDNEIKFQLGDKVMYAGMEGEIIEIFQDNQYPIVATFLEANENVGTYTFTLNGKRFWNHKAPLLTLIERPKKKRIVKMAPALFKNIHGRFLIGDCLYESEQDAKTPSFIRLLWDRAVEVEVEE